MTASAALILVQRRAAQFGLGFASGVALWGLAEHWDNPVLPAWAYLALFYFISSYATLALALSGPVPVHRALGGALYLAVPLTLLISLAGRRYDVATDVLDQPILLSVSLLFLLLATPFLIVWQQDRRQWTDYSALFEAAWALTIRYLSAWIFTGLFWLMMFLSDALLSLVRVEIIAWIFETEWLIFALTGGVLGLALAVVYELRTTVSPFLLLRLLRLLVVPVLLVVALFLAAIPLRGLSQVFGEFSAATTLMGVGMVMLTLVSVVLERDDAKMLTSRAITLATQMMALLLPLVTGLAAWSIGLRVVEYGWTPDRVLAAWVAGFLLAYGLLYAQAVARRSGWTVRIRRANVTMALAAIVVAAAFLTPLLNTNRIAANSQMSRFLDGRLTVDDLPLWTLQNDWGLAGRAAISHLENREAGLSQELETRLSELRSANSAWAFEQGIRETDLEDVKNQLLAGLPMVPQGQRLGVKDLDGLRRNKLKFWLNGCNRSLPDGRPGCVLVFDQFVAGNDRQALLFYRRSVGQASVAFDLIRFENDGSAQLIGARALPLGGSSGLSNSVIEQLLDGDFAVGPGSHNSLYVDGVEIQPRP